MEPDAYRHLLNDTPEAMAELICLALDLKKTRQDNMILLFN